jgi:hypothetical protein
MTEPVHRVHPSLFENLDRADHTIICRHSLAHYDEAVGSYFLDFLQERYCIEPHNCVIKSVTGPISAVEPSVDLQIILLIYLLNAREIPLAEKLVAPSSLSGGKNFFQGSHRLPMEPVLARYDRDKTGFLGRGGSLGATQKDYGDAALVFTALPRVPVVMVLWEADEEFPARLSVLFDATIDKHLPLDAIYGLVTEICRRMTV